MYFGAMKHNHVNLSCFNMDFHRKKETKSYKKKGFHLENLIQAFQDSMRDMKNIKTGLSLVDMKESNKDKNVIIILK